MTTTTARRRRSAKEKGGEDFELRWRLVGRSVGWSSSVTAAGG